jgi:hypothetical protein
LDDEELDSEDEQVAEEILYDVIDVKMTSPKPRKRESRWDDGVSYFYLGEHCA